MRVARSWLLSGLVGLAACGPQHQPVTGSGTPDLQLPALTQRAVEVSGGTVLALADGRHVVASDADRDRLWVVDVTSGSIRSKIKLPSHSEPGRLAEGPNGVVFVALRGTGKLVTVDPLAGSITETRDACAEPRGITWDVKARSLRLACSTGELLAFPAVGPATDRQVLERDLRDPVVTTHGVMVTTFRSAKLLPVGNLKAPAALPEVPIKVLNQKAVGFVANAAWRAIGTPGGGAIVVHQRAVDGDIDAIQNPNVPPPPAYYSNSCNGAIVRSAVSTYDENGNLTGSIEVPGVLPVDVAVSKSGTRLAIAFAGDNTVSYGSTADVNGVTGGSCGLFGPFVRFRASGRPTGVAYMPDDTLVVHTRVPAGIDIVAPDQSIRQIAFTADDLEVSPGFELFHSATRNIACASCHMEGRDDGHTWVFFQESVRTPTLAGGVTQTVPFHWKGELKDLPALVEETFVTRMGGTLPDHTNIDALGEWLDAIPKPAASPDLTVEQLGRGEALFASAGCQTCHVGAALTNDTTVDVGTGGRFQVPSLRGVAARAPYLHDGRAKTLRDRFEATGGGDKHGTTSSLSTGQIDDLTAYLKSL